MEDATAHAVSMIAHIEAAASHTVTATAHAASKTAHMDSATVHVDVVTSHTARATAHIEASMVHTPPGTIKDPLAPTVTVHERWRSHFYCPSGGLLPRIHMH